MIFKSTQIFAVGLYALCVMLKLLVVIIVGKVVERGLILLPWFP